jgi:hypothetical protein
MNIFRALTILVMLAASACTHTPAACQSTLNIADLPAAMGEGVAAQPVYSGGGVKGWRIYNTRRSDQLTAQGITSGAMMTHVCGVPAGDIYAKGGSICCPVDTSREVEVTFQVNDQERKVMIKR